MRRLERRMVDTASWSFLDASWRWAGYAADASWAQVAGRNAIERLRTERLSRLLAWTRRQSRFYAAHWGKDAQRDLRLDDLPAVRKADLMAHFDDWVTDPAVKRRDVERFVRDLARIGEPFLGRYAVFSSSGTTGVPGLIVHDADALAVYEALGATRMGALAPSWRWSWSRQGAGHRYALIAATEGHFAGIVGWERLRAINPWFEGHARVFPVSAPIREICTELERFRPTVIASYATVLRALAHERDAGRLDVAPAVLLYGGEWLAPMAREHIERAFGCRVAGDYGASEFVNIAFECEHGALHLNDDWVILEPVDEDYRPVPPDTASASALLTNLANRVQPLVRYELGDSITLVSRPCACGRPFPVIRVDGRRDEILRLHDARGREVPLMPIAVCTAIEEQSGAHRFQVVQNGPRSLRVKVEAASRQGQVAERVRLALARFLARQGLAAISTRVVTGRVAAHPVSGKFRQVWRERPPGA